MPPGSRPNILSGCSRQIEKHMEGVNGGEGELGRELGREGGGGCKGIN